MNDLFQLHHFFASNDVTKLPFIGVHCEKRLKLCSL